MINPTKKGRRNMKQMRQIEKRQYNSQYISNYVSNYGKYRKNIYCNRKMKTVRLKKDTILYSAYNCHTFNYGNFFIYCLSFPLSSPLELSSYQTYGHQMVLYVLTFFPIFHFFTYLCSILVNFLNSSFHFRNFHFPCDLSSLLLSSFISMILFLTVLFNYFLNSCILF